MSSRAAGRVHIQHSGVTASNNVGYVAVFLCNEAIKFFPCAPKHTLCGLWDAPLVKAGQGMTYMPASWLSQLNAETKRRGGSRVKMNTYINTRVVGANRTYRTWWRRTTLRRSCVWTQVILRLLRILIGILRQIPGRYFNYATAVSSQILSNSSFIQHSTIRRYVIQLHTS
jgi:hypothetical protein